MCNNFVISPAPACRGTGGIMGLRATQADDKTPRSSNHSLWNPCPSLSSREPVTFSIFSCFSIPNQLHSKPPTKPSSCLPRLAVGAKRFADRSQTEALWRGVEEPVPSVAEGTPAMLVGRCFWELSDRKLHRKIKKSQPPSEADLSRHAVEGSAVPRTLPGSVFRQSEVESR